MASASLSMVYNMLPLADDLGTSGQPTSAQCANDALARGQSHQRSEA